jgi:beta-ureidopropionase
MSRFVKCAHIQLSLPKSKGSILDLKRAMIQKHLSYIEEAGKKGVNILCLQELFFGPYFCAEQNPKWFDYAEKIPGETTKILGKYAKKHQMVIIAPIFEQEIAGVYYNTAVIINTDGAVLGKMRKVHIPHAGPGYWEKFYFRPGNVGFPVFETPFAKIGVYICYDRHYPECARILALGGAEIIFSPCAAAEHEGESMWEEELDNPTWARINGVFIGGNNRVGVEKPWDIGRFYGSSYFVSPRGKFIIRGGKEDELVTADLDLDEIRKARNDWPLFRDRRPEMYGKICE